MSIEVDSDAPAEAPASTEGAAPTPPDGFGRPGAYDFSVPLDPAVVEEEHRSDRRRRVVSVLVSAVVVLASVAVVVAVFVGRAGEPDETAAGAVSTTVALPEELFLEFDAEVGDCLDFEADGDVVERRCGRSHDGEVFATASYSTGSVSFEFPGDEALTEFAVETCIARFEDYVGVDFYHSRLDVTFMWPSESSWRLGDRTIQCVATNPTGSGLETSVRDSGGITHPGYLATGAEAAGECFNDTDDTWLIPTVPCSEPHDNEVFAVITHPAQSGAPFPGDAALFELAAECEAAAFEDYVAISYAASSLAAGSLYPSADSWRSGNRDVVCFLYAPSGVQLDEPMAGTGTQTALGEGTVFTAADLPGIVLQPYEAPAGTEHDYSMALTADELLATFEEPFDGLAPEATYWVDFSTPAYDSAGEDAEMPADAVHYVIAAHVYPNAKDASLELQGYADIVQGEQEVIGEVPTALGDESWAAHYLSTVDVAEHEAMSNTVVCEWRIGNVLVAVTAWGPGADPTTVLEIARTMEARAAGDPAPPPATQPLTDQEAAIHAADSLLIEGLYEGETAAWAESIEAGIQHWVDHQYPDLGYTYDECRAALTLDGSAKGFFWNAAVDPSTITRTDEWTIPHGRLADQPLKGRVYEYQQTVQVHRAASGGIQYPPSIATSHATILDGKAHYFPGCD